MNLIYCCLGWIFTKMELIQKRCKSIYNASRIHIGRNSHISGKCEISNGQNIFIGDNSYINSGHLGASPNGKIIIGDNCLISYNVHCRTDMHNYKSANIQINKQGIQEKDILTGNDVWVGYGVQILGGCRVGEGAVIGAGAIVTPRC